MSTASADLDVVRAYWALACLRAAGGDPRLRALLDRTRPIAIQGGAVRVRPLDLATAAHLDARWRMVGPSLRRALRASLGEDLAAVLSWDWHWPRGWLP